ncbi:MAG: hypothetical protein ABEJ56_06305 [Candidatus Nanohaloarchaea archaeon]
MRELERKADRLLSAPEEMEAAEYFAEKGVETDSRLKLERAVNYLEDLYDEFREFYDMMNQATPFARDMDYDHEWPDFPFRINLDQVSTRSGFAAKKLAVDAYAHEFLKSKEYVEELADEFYDREEVEASDD